MFELEIHNQNTSILHCMNAFIEAYEKPNTRRTYTTIITRYINYLTKLHDKAASVDLVVKAGAPEAPAFFNQSGTHTQLDGPDSRHISAGSGSDDQKVVCLLLAHRVYTSNKNT